MADDVLVKIRTALDSGGLDAAKRALGGLESEAQKASAAGDALGVNWAQAGRRIAAGLAVGATALAAFIKKGIDTADQLNVVSKRVGVSVEVLSRLKFAAEQTETNFETLTRGLQRLNINIGKTGVEGAELIPVLLGIAEKVKNAGSAAEAAAISNQALGRGIGAELLPVLKEGEAGIRKLIGAEADFAEISTETAQAADAFNDSLSKLSAQATALAISFAGPLVDSVNSFVEALGRAGNISEAKEANEQFRQSAEEITTEISEIDALLAGGAPAKEGIMARRAELEKLKAELISTRKEALGVGGQGADFVGPPKPVDDKVNRAVDEITKIKKVQGDADKEKEKADKETLTREKALAVERTNLRKQALSEQNTAAKEAAKFEQERIDQLQEAMQEEQAARDEVKQSIADQAAGIQEQINAVNAEAEALRIGGAEGVRYAVIQREVASAIRELGEDNLTAQAISKIRELADAQAALFAQREGEQQIQNAAEQTARQFEQQSNAITQTLTDAIFRGFENGKGIAENFKDTVVNLFKTLVLRPIIEAVVTPVAQAVSGVVGSLVQGALGSLVGGGGGGGMFGGLLAAGGSALFQQGGGSSNTAAGGSLITDTLRTGFTSLVTSTETVTAAINQLGYSAGLTGGPSGQAGLLGAQSASSLLSTLAGGAAIAGLSYGLGGIIGKATGSALQGAAAGAAGGAAVGAAVGSVVPVIGTAIGALIGAIAGGVGGGTGYQTPPRGFATFGAKGTTALGGKKGFNPDESLVPLGTEIQKSIQAIDKDLGLKLIKDRIKFWIGFKAGKGFRTTVAGKGDTDFEDPKRIQAEILRQEIKDADSGNKKSEFQKRVLARGLAKDTLPEQLASFDRDLKVRSRLRAFVKQVEFDPRTEKIKELKSEIKELGSAFSKLKGEAKELGLNTKRAEEAFKKTKRRKLDEILGIKVEGEAEKIGAQQQAYQLAGQAMPFDLQVAGVTAQFKVLGIKFRELGLDTKVLDGLLTEALENLRKQQSRGVIAAQAQGYQLAGMQAPLGTQQALLTFQFQDLASGLMDLGLNADELALRLYQNSVLLAEAQANLLRQRETAKVQVQAQAFQLAGREVPMELQRAGVQIQFAELGRQFQDLGLDTTILTTLLAEALANLGEAAEAAASLGKQISARSQAYQLGGIQAPLALQFAVVRQQFSELEDVYHQLGLNTAELAALMQQANADIYSARERAKTSAMVQAYQLGGREVPIELQKAALQGQFSELEDTFHQLGLATGILATLMGEAMKNLEEDIAKAKRVAKQSALERAYSLAGEEVPKAIQIAGIQAEFSDLGKLFKELGLDTGILGPLLQKAIDKINKAGEDLRDGGFIGFIDELGRITQLDPRMTDIGSTGAVAANDSQFFGGPSVTSPVVPVPKGPPTVIDMPFIPRQEDFGKGRYGGIGERAPESVLQGQGNVNINLNGPAVFDDISQQKFTRTVSRQLQSRRGRFGG